MIYSIYAIIGMSILSITFLIHLGIGYFIHSGLSAGLRLQTEGLEFQVWYFSENSNLKQRRPKSDKVENPNYRYTLADRTRNAEIIESP